MLDIICVQFTRLGNKTCQKSFKIMIFKCNTCKIPAMCIIVNASINVLYYRNELLKILVPYLFYNFLFSFQLVEKGRICNLLNAGNEITLLLSVVSKLRRARYLVICFKNTNKCKKIAMRLAVKTLKRFRRVLISLQKASNLRKSFFLYV